MSCHAVLALFASLASAPMKDTSISFWNDASRVSRLDDPPPSEILKKIQDRPWKGGFEPVPSHGIHLHEAQVIEGKIPEGLVGALFRNGPGRIRIGNIQYGHWFDGDGFVSRLCINGQSQKATYVAKYVETKRFQAQQQVDTKKKTDVGFSSAGAWTKRGKGQLWENLFAIPTNPSNTNVLYFQKPERTSISEIYALAEGGPPVEMNPITLETNGERSFKKRVNPGETTDSFFSAHYKKCPRTGEIFNHGLILVPLPTINLMKLDRFGNLIHQTTTDLPSFGFIHDNMLSENYFILLVQPYEAPILSLMESLIGGEPVGKRFEWNKERRDETIVMVYSRDKLERVAEVPIPLLSSYHNLNAFEDPNNDDVLKLRILAHDPPDTRIELEKCFSDLYTAKSVPVCKTIFEFNIDVKKSRLVSSRHLAPDAAPCELPDQNYAWGFRTKFAYTNPRSVGAEWADSLQKVNLESGVCSEVITFGDGVYSGAPIFVPRKDAKTEDDGYVFTQLYRSHHHGTDVCILDALTMKKLVTLRLAEPVPYQFHGTWYPGVF